MLERLVSVLSPEEIEPDVFLGENMHPSDFRIYGGQVLAQAVAAAARTVSDDRSLHSQHAYFLRPGDTEKPVRLAVERARDGGSFSSRRVVATQDDKPILVSSLSFNAAMQGGTHLDAAPEVPPPESLPSERQLAIAAGNLDDSFMVTTGEYLDVRVVEPVDWFNPRVREPHLEAWVRTTGRLNDDVVLHRAMLAYLSDMMLLDACLLPQGLDFMNPDLQCASLDHALWFHGDFRADEWLLHTVESEAVAGGLGLSRGRFYTQDGRLVASTMQQGLMRLR
ncbi:MAG: acyl-CoA thioesterase domain-containing protein [Pseudomonadota bacterium]